MIEEFTKKKKFFQIFTLEKREMSAGCMSQFQLIFAKLVKFVAHIYIVLNTAVFQFWTNALFSFHFNFKEYIYFKTLQSKTKLVSQPDQLHENQEYSIYISH